MLQRAWFGLCVAIALSGCASTLSRATPSADPGFEAAHPPAVVGDHTYQALVDTLPRAGERPLVGRTIVVDPGHGGSETGAVGPAGVMEKDVNLAVARRLAGLLRSAGARVVLTRDADREVGPAGCSLAEDLKARIDEANAIHADLFVSIHHNATLDPLNERNQTETYYKMDDPGPSEDAGRAIHRHLLRNLDLPQEKLLPGNYAVLRGATVPAVLGEASYLSNAFTEAKLRDPAKQLLEAEAYFAGILDYFAHGTPSITRFETPDASASERPSIRAQLDGGGTAIDPASVLLTLDAKTCAAYFDAQTSRVIFQPDLPLANGPHVLRLSARNLGGNATPTAEKTLFVDRPAARVDVMATLSSLPTQGPMPLSVRVTDALGLPVADGTAVHWWASTGRLRADQTLTRNGLAFDTLLEARTATRVRAQAGAFTASWALPASSAPALHGIVLGSDDKGLGSVTIVAEGRRDTRMTQSDAEGNWYLDSVPSGLRRLKFVRPGTTERSLDLVRPAYVTMRLGASMVPYLQGQTIVLNPEGGVEDPVPARRRMADYNYLVADKLRGYLQAAGANVVLTRGPDENPNDVQRVRVANRLGAMLFLTIGHGTSDRVVTSHYPRSAKGEQIAKAIRAALSSALEARDGVTEPDSSYTLIETTCPSVTVVPGSVTPGADDTPPRARREAYGIMLGLMPRDPLSAALRVRVRRHGLPVPDARVTADGQWIGQTDVTGTWRFFDLAPGDHELIVSDGRQQIARMVPRLGPGEVREVPVDLAHPADRRMLRGG